MLDSLWNISIIVNHVLMVVVRGVEVAEHCHRFQLRPTSPSSYHTWGPVLVLETILTASSTEGMGPKQIPLQVSHFLEVLGKGPANLGGCLGREAVWVSKSKG